MSVVRKVGVVICGRDPMGDWRVLLRKNSPFNGSAEEWNVIYGHIERAEDSAECAQREVQEETGLTAADVSQSGRNISRVFPDNREISIEYFWTRFIGLPTNIRLNEESIGYQWSLRDEVEVLVADELQREAILYCLEQATA